MKIDPSLLEVKLLLEAKRVLQAHKVAASWPEGCVLDDEEEEDEDEDMLKVGDEHSKEGLDAKDAKGKKEKKEKKEKKPKEDKEKKDKKDKKEKKDKTNHEDEEKQALGGNGKRAAASSASAAIVREAALSTISGTTKKLAQWGCEWFDKKGHRRPSMCKCSRKIETDRDRLRQTESQTETD